MLVEWRLEREFLYQTKTVAGSIGTIRLVAGGHAEEWQGRRSGTHTLSLQPGTYYLQVTIPDIESSDTVYFTVGNPPVP